MKIDFNFIGIISIILENQYIINLKQFAGFFNLLNLKKKIKKIFGFCSRLIEAFLTVKIAKSKNKSHSCDHRKGKADAGQKAGRFTSCIDAISRHPTASEKGARAQRPPLADVFLAMS